MFRVITIEREYGSGGAAIAEIISRQLGWKLLDRNLIDAVARTAQVDPDVARRYDEHVDSWWHRINRAGFWSAAVMAGVPPIEVSFFDAETMAVTAAEVIVGAAAKGACVIVGRGAQCVLKGAESILNVFVYAPLAERIARIQRRLRTSEDVTAIIRSTDHDRAAYIHTYFGADWKDPRLYHMMVNSQLGFDAAASLVIETANRGATVAQESAQVSEYNRL